MLLRWQATLMPWFFNCKDKENGGIMLMPCGGMLYACNGNCLKSNFSVLEAHILLREDQIQSLTLSSTSASSSVSATPNSSASSATPNLGSVSPPTTDDCPHRFTQESKTVAVGAGVGVSLGIIILVVVVLLAMEKRSNQRLRQEKRWTRTENGSYTGHSPIDQQGTAPQELARHEMPPGFIAYEMNGRGT